MKCRIVNSIIIRNSVHQIIESHFLIDSSRYLKVSEMRVFCFKLPYSIESLPQLLVIPTRWKVLMSFATLSSHLLPAVISLLKQRNQGALLRRVFQLQVPEAFLFEAAGLRQSEINSKKIIKVRLKNRWFQFRVYSLDSEFYSICSQ